MIWDSAVPSHAVRRMRGLGKKTPYSFGLGVEVGEAGLDVLDSERHRPSAYLAAARWSFRIIADDRSGSVGATFQLRHNAASAARRHAERDRDLADVGGKAGAATHPVMGARSPAYGSFSARRRASHMGLQEAAHPVIVRCFSASGSFHGYTVISAFGASEATSIESAADAPDVIRQHQTGVRSSG